MGKVLQMDKVESIAQNEIENFAFIMNSVAVNEYFYVKVSSEQKKSSNLNLLQGKI